MFEKIDTWITGKDIHRLLYRRKISPVQAMHLIHERQLASLFVLGLTGLILVLIIL